MPGHSHQPPTLSSLTSTSDLADIRELLDNVNALAAERRIGSCEYQVEPLYAGHRLMVVYDKGVLHKASLCADGGFVMEVTQHVHNIANVPQQIHDREKREIEGSVLLPKDAAGTFEQDLSERLLLAESAEAGLMFIPCGTSPAQLPQGTTTQMQVLEWISRQGFSVPPHIFLARSYEQVSASIFQVRALRDKLPYEISGAVIRPNSLELTQTLRETELIPQAHFTFLFSPKREAPKDRKACQDALFGAQ